MVFAGTTADAWDKAEHDGVEGERLLDAGT